MFKGTFGCCMVCTIVHVHKHQDEHQVFVLFNHRCYFELQLLASIIHSVGQMDNNVSKKMFTCAYASESTCVKTMRLISYCITWPLTQLVNQRIIAPNILVLTPTESIKCYLFFNQCSQYTTCTLVPLKVPHRLCKRAKEMFCPSVYQIPIISTMLNCSLASCLHFLSLRPQKSANMKHT